MRRIGVALPFAGLALAAAALATLAWTLPKPVHAEASFHAAPCDFKLPQGQPPSRVKCGWLAVPENRLEHGSRRLSLAVAVLKATGTRSHPALVFLDGGPGGATLTATFHRWTPSFAASLQADRDIVFFDQRGAGLSTPSLACPETAASGANSTRFSLLLKCHDRLETSADLSAYTSVESATDVADLMQSLGYQTYDVYGVSYGTRLALTVMRDRPYNVRAVVLDSTITPDADRPLDEARGFQRVLDQMTDDCNIQTSCATAYGNVRETFDRIAQRLSLLPVEAAPGGGTPVPVNRQTFVHDAFLTLYSTKQIAGFPRALSQIDKGLTAPLASLMVASENLQKNIAEGMQISVECNETYPFLDAAGVRRGTAGVDPELLLAGLGTVSGAALRSTQQFCRQWVHASPDAKGHSAVHSDIATLLLSGEYDPVTPPEWAYRAAATLSRSTVVTFRGTGHGVLGGQTQCASELIASFLDDPTRPVDRSCAEALRAPSFLVGD